MRKLVRIVCLVLYYGFAKHLPEHSYPRGMVWRNIRGAVTRPLFRHCGKEVHINAGVHFGKGDTLSIGDHSSLGINARVIGDVTIGNLVGMAQDIFITAARRQLDDPEKPIVLQPHLPDDPVVIEDNVIIFANVTILPGVRIGEGTVVGAGAVIAKDIPPNSVVVGNPAYVAKQRVPGRDPGSPSFDPKYLNQ